MAGSNDETITEGLDGLRERLKEYYDLEQGLQSGEPYIKLQKNFLHLSQ